MNKRREEVLLPDTKKLVEDNINFVYYLLKGFDILSTEYEEFVQIGRYGLQKAAMTFNPTKGVKFSEYAKACIRNAILNELRKRKVYAKEISLEEPLLVDENDTILCRYDVMADSKTSNYEEKLIARQLISEIISTILNVFPTQQKVIMLLTMASWKQEEIAQLFHLSQGYTSKLIGRYRARFNKDIELAYVKRKQDTEDFKVHMEESILKITFPTAKVTNFKRILANVLCQMDNANMDITDFAIIASKKWITIGMPAEAEYLAFIALLAKEIEDKKEETLI